MHLYYNAMYVSTQNKSYTKEGHFTPGVIMVDQTVNTAIYVAPDRWPSNLYQLQHCSNVQATRLALFSQWIHHLREPLATLQAMPSPPRPIDNKPLLSQMVGYYHITGSTTTPQTVMRPIYIAFRRSRWLVLTTPPGASDTPFWMTVELT